MSYFQKYIRVVTQENRRYTVKAYACCHQHQFGIDDFGVTPENAPRTSPISAEKDIS